MSAFLVDIGANLGHESFSHDLDEVLARARAACVRQLVITGASAQGSRDALAVVERGGEGLWATAGLHPHHAADYDSDFESELERLHEDPRVIAVGETGLDYFRDFSPRPAQAFAFERHLALAQRNGKPLFLHQRDAHADFMAILRPLRDRLGKIVVHCFTGTRAELHDYLDLDLHIGLTGWICDERRGQHMHEFLPDIPADRLMIETDSPYLLPRTLRPKPSHRRNEPAFLPEVLRVLAEVRRQDPDELARQTTATAQAFFGLPD
ncbi:MAG: TatD family hydrolase [Lysobacterales bacterium]